MQQTRSEKKRHKKRALEIAALKIKYKKSKWRAPLPDLSCSSKAAPLGNRLGGADCAPKKELPADAQKFLTGNLHKSGIMLVTEGMIAKGELKFMGGKKF